MSITLQDTTMTIAHHDQPHHYQADLARRFTVGFCYIKLPSVTSPNAYRAGALVGLAAVDSFELQPDYLVMFDEYELKPGESAEDIPELVTVDMRRIVDSSNRDYQLDCLNKVEATLTAQILGARGDLKQLERISWQATQVAPAYPSVAISHKRTSRPFVVMPCQKAADDALRYMRARLGDYLDLPRKDV